jgi:hypothetical protein
MTGIRAIAVVVKGPGTETSCSLLLPLFNARSIRGVGGCLSPKRQAQRACKNTRATAIRCIAAVFMKLLGRWAVYLIGIQE